MHYMSLDLPSRKLLSTTLHPCFGDLRSLIRPFTGCIVIFFLIAWPLLKVRQLERLWCNRVNPGSCGISSLFYLDYRQLSDFCTYATIWDSLYAHGWTGQVRLKPRSETASMPTGRRGNSAGYKVEHKCANWLRPFRTGANAAHVNTKCLSGRMQFEQNVLNFARGWSVQFNAYSR